MIFYINFDLKSNWIPNGIDVQDISCYGEEEILFQPFTFFKITKVDINFDKNTFKISIKKPNLFFYSSFGMIIIYFIFDIFQKFGSIYFYGSRGNKIFSSLIIFFFLRFKQF